MRARRPRWIDVLMRALLWPSVLSVLAASSLHAQTKTVAERLGHAADAKPLIIHADHLGTVIVAGPEVPRDRWKDYYLLELANLKPGVAELIVHLGRDDSELQAVTVNHEPYGSAWRQRDTEVGNSPEFRKALADNGVILITWRDLQEVLAQ